MTEIDLKDIVSNRDNTREPAPRLQQHGYCIVEPVEGNGKPSLFGMALGTPDDKRRYCQLVEKYEEGLTDLALSIDRQGQLQSCRVRPTGEGEYALTFGARRCLAVLYLHAKHGRPARILATVSEADEKAGVIESAAENAHHLPPSYIDQARLFRRMRDQGMTVKEIAHVYPMGKATEQNIRHRLRLLDLPQDVQLKVHHGKLSQDAALKLLKKLSDGGTEKPARGKGEGEENPVRDGGEGEGDTQPVGEMPQSDFPPEEGAQPPTCELRTALEEFIERVGAIDLDAFRPDDPDELLRLADEARRLLSGVEEAASKGTLTLVG